MRIATWNVNSIRARQEQVRTWIESAKPDILLLQEIKTEERDFPFFEFEALGYKATVKGQKSYNGVAILAREAIEASEKELPTFKNDPQARYCEIIYKDITIASIYAPNGNPVGTEKYSYKCEWMRKLKDYIQILLRHDRPFILGGDFNVLAEEKDAYDFSQFAHDALGLKETRKIWQEILHTGCASAYRTLHPTDIEYSFWDYQAGAWQRNMGLRLDDFLISPDIQDRLQSCIIDKTPRGQEKASDHTPVLLEIVNKSPNG